MKKTNKTKPIPPVYSSGYTTGPHNIKIRQYFYGKGYTSSEFVPCTAIDLIDKLTNPSNDSSEFTILVDNTYQYHVYYIRAWGKYPGRVKLYYMLGNQINHVVELDIRSLPKNEKDLLQMFFEYGYCHQWWSITYGRHW
jgi:hypothetical protein